MSAAAARRPDLSVALEPDLPDGTAFKLIGLGGVGGIVARYLAVFLRNLDRDARLVLIDGDAFEPDNARRMLFPRHGNKAEVVREELLPHLRDSRVSVVPVAEYVTAENVTRLVQAGDVVVLAVDNSATRKLVNDHCAGLEDVCLLSGGNDGVEEHADGRRLRGTYGNSHVYVRRGGQDLTPSLAKFHPEIRTPGDRHPEDASCTELAVSVPQILFANLTVAATLLNTLWLYLCGALHYPEICFDVAEGLMRPVDFGKPTLVPGPTGRTVPPTAR